MHLVKKASIIKVMFDSLKPVTFFKDKVKGSRYSLPPLLASAPPHSVSTAPSTKCFISCMLVCVLTYTELSSCFLVGERGEGHIITHTKKYWGCPRAPYDNQVAGGTKKVTKLEEVDYKKNLLLCPNFALQQLSIPDCIENSVVCNSVHHTKLPLLLFVFFFVF